jgi:nitroreductase
VAHLTIQAEAMGLGLRQMGGILMDEARAAYGIPDEYDVLNAIALGYPAAPDMLPDDLAERERQPRTRKPLSDIIFDDWAQPSRLVAGE